MNDLNNRTLTIEKTFNAPLKLVWEAWSQPEHIAQWWGPKGMETKVIVHEFKVGGIGNMSCKCPMVGNSLLKEPIQRLLNVKRSFLLQISNQ